MKAKKDAAPSQLSKHPAISHSKGGKELLLLRNGCRFGAGRYSRRDMREGMLDDANVLGEM